MGLEDGAHSVCPPPKKSSEIAQSILKKAHKALRGGENFLALGFPVPQSFPFLPSPLQ
jgi:hypothetical protein